MANEASEAQGAGTGSGQDAPPTAQEGAKRRRTLRLPMPAWLKRYVALLTDRSRSRGRRVLYLAGGMGALFGGLCLLLLLYALLLVPFTPSGAELNKAKAERPAVLLSSEGRELTQFRRLHREWVGLDEVAPEVIDALVATEDHRFYDHGGLDVRRIFSAILHTLVGDRQGGSTITQQLARNLYPDEIGRAFSVTRKLKESITALKIERHYSKDEILETYLNTVPFLYNVFGIELAARTYFSKSADDLDVLEAATLVGMLKGTSYYNPVRNPERAQRRRNVVLGQMVKHGKLSAEDFERIREEPVEVDFERQTRETSRAPHFTQFVREWLAEWADRNGYDLYADGLVVHTTLDLDLQRVAEQVVALQGDRLQAVADVEWARSAGTAPSMSLASYPQYRRRVRPFGRLWQDRPDLAKAFARETPTFRRGRAAGLAEEALLDSLLADDRFMDSLRTAKTRLEVSFAAIDPQTGHVRAWVGSRAYGTSPYDRVVRSRRQPGSTFKPFVYARALQEGFSPDDRLWDRSVEIPLEGGGVWRPANAGAASGEEVTLREGLVHSKNTITAQLVEKVGAGDVAALAERMGVNRSPLRKVPSIALGTSEVTLLEMVSAYATIADGGTYRPPVYVTRITDADGNVLETFAPEPEQALDEATALQLLDMMRGVVDEGTGSGIRRAFGLDADLAGKTGTTQGGADGWFLLMHPTLVSGAWVGFDDPRVTFRSDYWGQGAHNALYVVGEFSRRILGGRYVDRDARFPAPPEAEESKPILARIGGWFKDLLGGGDEPGLEEDRGRNEEDRDGDDEDWNDEDRNDEDRGYRRGRRAGPLEERAEDRAREEMERAREEALEHAREQREELERMARELENRLEERARERAKQLQEVERELRKHRREVERELRKRHQEAEREARRH